MSAVNTGRESKINFLNLQEAQKKQEDVHSDLSADTGTFDSGMGGSVSDTGTHVHLLFWVPSCQFLCFLCVPT